MKDTLIFATSNPGKVREVAQVLEGQFPVKSLKDIGCTEDIPETCPTLEGNALQKARYVYDKYQLDCFSEDTGLEVDALDGAPGVITARYAGEQRDNDANIDLLLKNLSDHTNRAAQFRTVVALILDGKEYTFEGIVRGHITKNKSGNKGFGYDPIFCPENHTITFAEMNSAEKNSMSHRGRAMKKLIDFLKDQ